MTWNYRNAENETGESEGNRRNILLDLQRGNGDPVRQQSEQENGETVVDEMCNPVLIGKNLNEEDATLWDDFDWLFSLNEGSR